MSFKQEHNLRYLICTTIGLKRHMWRLLYQLTLEEFRSYTNIHGGELLYTSEMDLKQCYEHVVIMGNWPLNLYVSLSKLRHLLHSKGVAMETLDLSQISPKIMHWNELVQHTDFDQIVELQYTDRTGKKFSDQKTLWQERKQFYADCWRHDEWIYQVPKISDGRLNEMPLGDIPPLVNFVWSEFSFLYINYYSINCQLSCHRTCFWLRKCRHFCFRHKGG